MRTVRERGIATLIKCSEKRCDEKGDDLVGLSAVTVHEKCTKLYTNEKSINASRERPRASIRPVAQENPLEKAQKQQSGCVDPQNQLL